MILVDELRLLPELLITLTLVDLIHFTKDSVLSIMHYQQQDVMLGNFMVIL
jgi:hypothetical protein